MVKEENASLSNYSEIFETLKDSLNRVDQLNELLTHEIQVVIKKYGIQSKDQIKCRKLIAEREEISNQFINKAQILLSKLDDKESNLRAIADELADDDDNEELFYDGLIFFFFTLFKV